MTETSRITKAAQTLGVWLIDAAVVVGLGLIFAAPFTRWALAAAGLGLILGSLVMDGVWTAIDAARAEVTPLPEDWRIEVRRSRLKLWVIGEGWYDGPDDGRESAGPQPAMAGWFLTPALARLTLAELIADEDDRAEPIAGSEVRP